jgi:hypothetical protein
MISTDERASLVSAITCHLNTIAHYAAELRQPHTRTERRWMRQNQKAHQARIAECQKELQDDA